MYFSSSFVPALPESLSLLSQEDSPISRERRVGRHHRHRAEPHQLQGAGSLRGLLSLLSLIRKQMDCLLLKAVGSINTLDFWPTRSLGNHPCSDPHFPDEEPEVWGDKWLVRAAGPRLQGKPPWVWCCCKGGQETRKKPNHPINSSYFSSLIFVIFPT